MSGPAPTRWMPTRRRSASVRAWSRIATADEIGVPHAAEVDQQVADGHLPAVVQVQAGFAPAQEPRGRCVVEFAGEGDGGENGPSEVVAGPSWSRDIVAPCRR